MKKIAVLIMLSISSVIFADTVEVWHRWNKEESVALLKNISRFEAETGHTVVLKYLDYKIISGKFISASKLNRGPDLIITKASVVENFANEDLLHPINDLITKDKKDSFIKSTLDDAYLGDKLYGLPVTYKLLALIYNKDLMKIPPKTTDELFDMGRKFTNTERGEYALAYPVEDYYYHIPWIHSFNGKLVGDGKVYFNSTPHKKALNFVRSLQLGNNPIVPEGVTYDLMLSLFVNGKIPMIINGTWIIGDLLKENMNVAAARIPKNSESGKYPAPYVTSELVIMSKYSKNKETAYQLMDFLTSDAAQLEGTKIGHLPTITSVYENESFINGNSYDILSGFRDQAKVAVKEPKDIIMTKIVWNMGASMLTELLYDNNPADDRLDQIQKNAEEMIKVME